MRHLLSVVDWKKLSWCVLVFLLPVLLGACEKESTDAPTPAVELIGRISGSYQILEGVYDTISVEGKELTIQQISDRQAIVSGEGFPDFVVSNFTVGYQDPSDKAKYTIFSDVENSPNGTVVFDFPEKKIQVNTTLYGDVTEKFLNFNGLKIN